MADQPNVIVVMCDQPRASEVGCYGNDFIMAESLTARLAEWNAATPWLTREGEA